MEKVLFYTTATWPHCPPAKEYLVNKGVSLVERDIRADISAKEELLKLGSRGVPTIVIGDEVIIGFDKEKIDSLLSK